MGCDWSGIVEQVNVGSKSGLTKGDRVMGLAHGGNTTQLEDGAFAEIAMGKEGLLARIPDGMSFEDAATFPSGICTVCMQNLWEREFHYQLSTASCVT